MMITAMTKTEYDWSYEQVRQVLIPPVGSRNRNPQRDRRQQQSFSEDYVELSLDSLMLAVEDQLARGWALFSSN